MQARYRVPWITYSNKMRPQAKRKLIHILKSAYPEFYSNKISCMWSVPVIYSTKKMKTNFFFHLNRFIAFKSWICLRSGGRREGEERKRTMEIILGLSAPRAQKTSIAAQPVRLVEEYWTIVRCRFAIEYASRSSSAISFHLLCFELQCKRLYDIKLK